MAEMHTHALHFPPAPRWLAPALLTLAVLGGCASAPPVDPSAPAVPAPVAVVAPPATPFARWVADFSLSARAAGITEATLHQAFENVRLIPHVIDSDQAQPEFTRTVWAYLDSAVSPQRVSRGQTRLRNLPPEVDTVPARYGVPLEIVVAIWGMESNYGSFTGDIPTIDALATLGFEGRREAWARSQLLALQTALNARGFDSGTPDGVMGPATRSGVRAYQRSLNLPADGYPTLELLERLQ